MLILTRRINQSVQIGDDITVTVTQIDHRGAVRLGIDAPKHVPIVRDELQIKALMPAKPKKD